MADKHEVLQKYFGFEHFRAGQADAIDFLLAGHSAAAVFPTGAGKSLCYQLPALMLPGLTLVVSPLIALMKDQIDQLTKLGIAAKRLDSTLGAGEAADIMQQARSGKLRLLFVAPERFNNERFREAMKGLNISLAAVDEAHCISEWGHNFRPDYLKLPVYFREFGVARVLALTATAPDKALADICRGFEIDHQHVVKTGFYRPNLELQFSVAETHTRDDMLLSRLRSRAKGPTIVYVTFQRTANELAASLKASGINARAYHAGMKSEDRATVQEWFLASRDAVVVATIAFGMGIDKPDIRYVYHYNMAKSLENYAQEIGRAGRDQQPSLCEMLLCTEDLGALENFAYGDTPEQQSINGFLEEVFSGPETLEVSLMQLSQRHDIRMSVLQTLFTYLELDGLITAMAPIYAEYKFAPGLPLTEISHQFNRERAAFLSAVFSSAEAKLKWWTVDIAKAAQASGSSRQRVIRALDYLAERGLIELTVSGIRNRYRKRASEVDLSTLAHVLYERMVGHEKREIDRIYQVLALATADECQTRRLAAYFGDELSRNCGHCLWCEGDKTSLQLPPRPVLEIPSHVWKEALNLRKRETALASPRSFTRFLCGTSSPRLVKNRLTRHDLFGVFASVPFADILKRAKV